MLADAQVLDERDAVAGAMLQAGPAVRASARTALDASDGGNANAIPAFLSTGWQRQADVDLRVAVNQLMAAGGDRVKADLERVRADVEREQARTADWRRRAETLTSELHEMRTRLENAQRATESANEQLMAMEVKLDLIEAAIQVLDSRTREQAVSRSL